jgi:hypothetical protein
MEVRASLLKMLKTKKSGELIEPLKPLSITLIRLHLEYIKQDIDDWQIAFERVGKMLFVENIGPK